VPIDINTDISRILTVAEHYGGEMPPAMYAVVAQLSREIHSIFEDLKRDINDKLEQLEHLIKYGNTGFS